MYEYPVTDEPDQDVDKIETDGVCFEEYIRGEGGQGPRQHTFRERLQTCGVGDHGGSQFYPSETK